MLPVPSYPYHSPSPLHLVVTLLANPALLLANQFGRAHYVSSACNGIPGDSLALVLGGMTGARVKVGVCPATMEPPDAIITTTVPGRRKHRDGVGGDGEERGGSAGEGGKRGRTYLEGGGGKREGAKGEGVRRGTQRKFVFAGRVEWRCRPAWYIKAHVHNFPACEFGLERPHSLTSASKYRECEMTFLC